jgi:stage II sporulation protein AA (anti-sigma F factor antagonist)
MQVTIHEFGAGGKKVVLVGSLDIAGAREVEAPLAAAAGSKCDIVIDLIGVDFVASVGLRQLVIAAKTVGRSGRKLVLLGANPMVTEIMLTSGLQDLLPIVWSEDQARIAFASSVQS